MMCVVMVMVGVRAYDAETGLVASGQSDLRAVAEPDGRDILGNNVNTKTVKGNWLGQGGMVIGSGSLLSRTFRWYLWTTFLHTNLCQFCFQKAGLIDRS